MKSAADGQRRPPSLPLTGMRVCEISHHLSGPLCGLLLAEFGAEVVRIEHPAGDRMRGIFANGAGYGAPFAATNRGKRIVRADLRTPEGKADARQIISRCDVLVTNFKPDTLLKLSLGPDEVRGINGDAIYLSLSSCGWDKGFRGVGMDDGMAQAMSGLAMATGWPDDEPVLAPVPIGAIVSALFGAMATTAAWARRSSASIDCALLDSLAMCLEFPLMKAVTFGEVPARNGGRHPTSSPSQPFRTKDGYLALMAASKTDFHRLMNALKLGELIDDPRFHNCESRLQNRSALESLIETVLMANDTLSWFEQLSAAGIACAPMQTVSEAVEHAKRQNYGIIRTLPVGDEECEIVAIPGGRASRGLGDAATPTEAAIEDICWPEAQQVCSMRPVKKLLSGVRVLDLTRFLSGPFATLLLSDLGADVLKVEPPGGDPARGFSPFLDGKSGYFTSVNRGKRFLEVDLKSPAGRDWLLEECARADILIENYRPGVMDRLGLTHEALSARNPNLVCVSISGYGRNRSYASRTAFDMTMQAFTGIMHQTGHGEHEYTRLGFSAGDIATGLFAAFGAVAEFAGVERGAVGGTTLEIPMFDALLAVIEPLIVRQSVGHPSAPKSGARHTGGCPIGMFKCADGFIYLSAAEDASFEALTRILQLAETHPLLVALDKSGRQTAARQIDAAVEVACANQHVATLLEKLKAVGILAGPVHDPLSAVRSPIFTDRDMFEARDGFQLVRSPFRDIGTAAHTVRQSHAN